MLMTDMSKENEMVSFTELAKKLAMHKAHANRYVKKATHKLDIQIRKWRDPDAGNQLVMAVSAADAERLVEYRRNQGFLGGQQTLDIDKGVFYVVQLVPDLDPKRIKLGFAVDMAERLQQHRTAAPTADVLKTWRCKRAWETTVMEALVCEGCSLILNEVYECDDVSALLERGEKLFNLLPDPDKKIGISETSPLRSDKRDSQPAAQRDAEDRAR
jgi:hypothetical protein